MDVQYIRNGVGVRWRDAGGNEAEHVRRNEGTMSGRPEKNWWGWAPF